MSKLDESVVLPNGCTVPLVGLGTSKSKNESIQSALECGYRHLDCAHVHRNEKEVGKGIAQKLNDSNVRRNELFIASKLGVSSMHPDNVIQAFQTSVRNLGLDYLDLYYIHWPFSLKYSGPENNFPTDALGNPLLDESTNFVETWSKMEELYHTGKVRAIGVSNFNISQLKMLLKNCSVPPHAHQFECHPYLNQMEMVEFCKSHYILPIAYSPLCRNDYQRSAARVNLFEDQLMISLANKYKKSIAQIALRYQIQRGIAVIPRSTNKTRMAENLSVFDFWLSDSDMNEITSLNRNARIIYPDKFASHTDFVSRGLNNSSHMTYLQ